MNICSIISAIIMEPTAAQCCVDERQRHPFHSFHPQESVAILLNKIEREFYSPVFAVNAAHIERIMKVWQHTRPFTFSHGDACHHGSLFRVNFSTERVATTGNKCKQCKEYKKAAHNIHTE